MPDRRHARRVALLGPQDATVAKISTLTATFALGHLGVPSNTYPDWCCNVFRLASGSFGLRPEAGGARSIDRSRRRSCNATRPEPRASPSETSAPLFNYSHSWKSDGWHVDFAKDLQVSDF